MNFRANICLQMNMKHFENMRTWSFFYENTWKDTAITPPPPTLNVGQCCVSASSFVPVLSEQILERWPETLTQKKLIARTCEWPTCVCACVISGFLFPLLLHVGLLQEAPGAENKRSQKTEGQVKTEWKKTAPLLLNTCVTLFRNNWIRFFLFNIDNFLFNLAAYWLAHLLCVRVGKITWHEILNSPNH